MRHCYSAWTPWHGQPTFAEQENVIKQVVHLWGGLQQRHQDCPLHAARQAMRGVLYTGQGSKYVTCSQAGRQHLDFQLRHLVRRAHAYACPTSKALVKLRIHFTMRYVVLESSPAQSALSQRPVLLLWVRLIIILKSLTGHLQTTQLQGCTGSGPVLISSRKSVFAGPTIISPAA